MSTTIKTIPIADLKPAPYNPRKDLKPGDAEYEKIKQSITAFGFIEPLVWNERTGNVVGGHQRLKVLIEQGVKSVPCVVVDFDEDTERAANLALNKIGGDWDFSKLADVLLELEHANFDLDLTGFDAGEIKNIMGWTPGADSASDDDFDADAALAALGEPTAKRGDIWQLGRHRVMCGDSTSADDVKKLMDGARAHLCLTDPPYGVEWKYASYTDTIEALTKLVNGFMPLVREVSDYVLLTPGNKNQWIYPTPDWTMAWFVPAGTGLGPSGFTCWQQVLVYGKDPYLAHAEGSRPDALCKTETSPDIDHPCPKPLGVWQWFMERGSRSKNDKVLDPFLGSGTTLIAAEQLNRVCYGMEIEPRYVDVAIQRWELLTGQKADLATGNTDGDKTHK